MNKQEFYEYCEKLRALICIRFNLTLEDFFAKSRKRERVIARTYFCQLAIEKNQKCTLEFLGMFINRDHSTVINCFKKFEDDFTTNENFRNDYYILKYEADKL